MVTKNLFTQVSILGNGIVRDFLYLVGYGCQADQYRMEAGQFRLACLKKNTLQFFIPLEISLA